MLERPVPTDRDVHVDDLIDWLDYLRGCSGANEVNPQSLRNAAHNAARLLGPRPLLYVVPSAEPVIGRP